MLHIEETMKVIKSAFAAEKKNEIADTQRLMSQGRNPFSETTPVDELLVAQESRSESEDWISHHHNHPTEQNLGSSKQVGCREIHSVNAALSLRLSSHAQ